MISKGLRAWGGKKEVFVDCGAYSGDTAEVFIKKNPRYKCIVAIEPDERNLLFLKKRMKEYNRISIIKAGCSNYDGMAYLNLKSNTGGNYVSLNAEGQDAVQITLKKIDSCAECRDATFIKMDIEGAEMDALLGAEETIRRNHPKLAICLYHRDEDMLRIPEYIHRLVPEYHLYIRAHTMGIAETVLYAIDRTGR